MRRSFPRLLPHARCLPSAKALKRKVRAVVKDLNDQDHLVAQGQENSARANLSFLEKELFAAEIARRPFDCDNAITLSALFTDRATFSRMLAVSTIPRDVLDGVGAAKEIGRDRWYELKIPRAAIDPRKGGSLCRNGWVQG
ncbi:hypothetical protein [Ensifer sp. MJa1]|uniref:hypothetical protein n=1 Tax=Ensifer sp. MJa1 TaxID=2919888 RepID=UPI00300B476B